MAHYNVTITAAVSAQSVVVPYRHGGAVIFQCGVNTLRWLSGALTIDWGSHDAED
jgi:hypothetical protein